MRGRTFQAKAGKYEKLKLFINHKESGIAGALEAQGLCERVKAGQIGRDKNAEMFFTFAYQDHIVKETT